MKMNIKASAGVYAATIIAVCVFVFASTSVSARSHVDPRSLIALDATGNVQSDVTAAVSVNKCTYGGVMGVCQSTPCKGKTYTGLCTGSSSVTCCIPSSSSATSAKVQEASAGGQSQTTLQRLSETEHQAKFARFNTINKQTYATAAKKQAAYSIFRLNRVKIIYLNDRYGSGRTIFSSESPYTTTTESEFARTKLGVKKSQMSSNGSFLEIGADESDELAPMPAAVESVDPHWAVFQEMAARADAEEADQAPEVEFLEVDAEVDADSDAVSSLPAIGEVCDANGQKGLCAFEAGCIGRKGTSFAHFCAGPSDVKCCVASTPTPPTPTPSTPTPTPAPTPAAPVVPDKMDVDYRAEMQPIRNQGGCGSCWAHSTLAVLEHAAKKAGLPSKPLAVQWLVDCDRGGVNAGCSGGLPKYAFEYARDQRLQPALESEYPYTDQEQATCSMKTGHSGMIVANTGRDVYCHATTADLTCDKADEKGLLAALKKRGAMAVNINADNWQFYKAGEILPASACSHGWNTANHGVVLVGYGTDGKTGKPFWLVRNSWGAKWGADGHVRLEANIAVGSACGVANFPYWAEVKKA